MLDKCDKHARRIPGMRQGNAKTTPLVTLDGKAMPSVFQRSVSVRCRAVAIIPQALRLVFACDTHARSSENYLT
jgi:hypothetical protein